MEWLLKALVVAVIAGLVSMTLEKNEPVFAMLIGLASILCIMVIGTTLFRPIRSFLDRLLQSGDGSGVYTAPLLKSLGIVLITRFGAAICRDAKQSGPASAVELIGVLAALCAALPLFDMFLSTLEEML